MRNGSRNRKVAAQLKAQQPWCSSCGSPGTAANPLTIDHIIPLSRGGTNARENKTVLCYRCNRLKSDALGPNVPAGDDRDRDHGIVIA
jgi:5-methylcytosine-specific restriction endonuclease McrA